MHRFFVAPEQIEGDRICITGEDVKHISRVLRLKEGDEIFLCDGQCNEYRTRITAVEKERVTVRVEESFRSLTEPEVRLTIYQGIPKAGKLETIIQKGTEMGVGRFVPFECSRAVVRPWKPDDAKCARYQRVAYEAAKQSRRGCVPEVCAPVEFGAVCSRMKEHSLSLIAWEEEGIHSLREVLQAAKKEGSLLRDIAVVIGPEGGLSAEEACALTAGENGARTVSLGRRILRTETAGMAAAAMILYEMDEMEP